MGTPSGEGRQKDLNTRGNRSSDLEPSWQIMNRCDLGLVNAGLSV